MPVPVVVHKGYSIPNFIGENTLVLAVSFSGNTEETVDAATNAMMQGGRVVAHQPRRRARRPGRDRGRPRTSSCPTASRCRGPASAPRRCRCSSCSNGSGCSRAPRRGSHAAVEQLEAPARPADRRRQRGRGAGPAHRPHHPADLRRRRARRGRGHAVEDAGQRERQGTGLLQRATPSSATTRSAAGASTATSPARCSRSSTCATSSSIPQVGRRFELRRRRPRRGRRWRPHGESPRARGRWPSCSTSSLFGDFFSLHLAYAGRRRSRTRSRCSTTSSAHLVDD